MNSTVALIAPRTIVAFVAALVAAWTVLGVVVALLTGSPAAGVVLGAVVLLAVLFAAAVRSTSGRVR